MKRSLPALLLVAPLLASPALGQGAPEADSPAPTYYEDVAPIFQQRCMACHREGGAGPFAINSYDEAAGWSGMIGEVVRDRRMPPWHADPEIGEFSNSRALSADERNTILRWVDADAPAGDPANEPTPPQFPALGDWRLGEPDVVLESPRAFTVPATGALDYQYWRMTTDFPEDRWVRAMEIQVDAPEVVHHVLVFIIHPDGSHPRVRGGLRGFFWSALPGDLVEPFPQGSAKLLPAGAQLVFQIHYTPNGEEQVDRTRLGLHFAEDGEEITRTADTVALYDVDFKIPPGAADHVVRGRYRFDKDVILYGLLPHMHVRGKSFRYLLRYPDGTFRPLLHVPQWDFNWQNTYRFAEPVFVPAGSKMIGIASFDNSADNPANPNPDREVTFGEQTWDEMMIGYMDLIEATPEDRAAWEAARASEAGE